MVGLASDEPPQTPQSHPQPPQPKPHPQPPQTQPEEIIDLSSSSDERDQPPPRKMLIPKTEEAILPMEEEQRSQAVVEVVPIYPTQEVIDLSSSPEDDRQQQPFVVKQEQDVDTSPGSRLITSTLMSFRDQVPLEAPTFDLGVEEPLLTTQTMQAIDEIDEQLRQNPALLQSPEPSGTFDILADME
ncbi:hypothetical protein PIB30_068650 [Stylosanthes scabra]|uniref:Uncharacterized protein n=1 Tax=Stylosanthes scabra TaxID=79078 RepID=A0ABU6XPC3_9FABA|nr:hypothetical protein [Stylosanthes scabra]